jgi:hypothetical protein
MSDDLVVAKTVQTAPIRILAEGLKSMLVEMSLVFDKDGIRMIAMDLSLIHISEPTRLM